MSEKSKKTKREVSYQPFLGVKSDFEQLIQRFTDTETVRYEKFADIWREMKFSLYCAGRDTDRECREFVEECFKIAVQFLLPPSTFQVRAGAVYLLYGLYNFQACRPKMKIRMTPDSWKNVMEFQELVHYQHHLDIDYILHKLRIDKAFILTFHPIELYPTQKEIRDNSLPETFKDAESCLEEVFSSHTLNAPCYFTQRKFRDESLPKVFKDEESLLENQLALIHDQYNKMKIALSGEDAEIPDSSIDIIHPDLIKAVYSTLSTHRKRIANVATRKNPDRETKGNNGSDEHEEEHDDEDDEDDGRAVSKKSRLKQKAFKTQKGKRKAGNESMFDEDSSPQRKQPGPKRHMKTFYENDIEGSPFYLGDSDSDAEPDLEVSQGEELKAELEAEHQIGLQPGLHLKSEQTEAVTAAPVLSMPDFDEPISSNVEPAKEPPSLLAGKSGKKRGRTRASLDITDQSNSRQGKRRKTSTKATINKKKT